MALDKLAFLLALAVSLRAWAGTGADEMSEPQPLDTTRGVHVAHTYRRPAMPTAYYEPPTTNVRFVAPGGNDAGPGSAIAPYRTLRKALEDVNGKADDGSRWTIVMKAGTYREGELEVTRPNVTIQRHKGDPVSLRGSLPLTRFSPSAPYTQTLTPQDVPNLPLLKNDCADPHLRAGATRHYGAEFPLAVFRAGVPLRRVQGPNVLSGQYAYNHTSNVLTLADSPTEIEVTSKRWAIRSSASNVKLAGLDIQGYATCAVDWKKTVNGTDYFKGAVLLFDSTAGAVLENSTVANNAGSAVAVSKARNVRLSGNTIVNNGWNGVHAGTSPGLVVDNNTISFNNVRRWVNAVEAGMKITFIEDGVIYNNLFEHNAATGFWCDQGCGSTNPSANWFIVSRNVVRNNDSKGIFYELSHHGVIASNVVHDNGESGIAVFGSRHVELWNNTVVDNNASAVDYTGNVSVVDDRRCFLNDTLPGGADCTVGNGCDPRWEGNNHDHCEPSSVGYLANTCNAEHVRIMNNIISGSKGMRPLLNVEDPNQTRYGADLIVDANDYQAYYRPSTSAPTSLIDWQQNAGSDAIAYPSLSAFQDANDCRESHSVERSGGTAHPYFVDYPNRNLAQNPASAEVWGRGATLPLEVLKAVYWPQTAPAQPSPRIGAIEWRGQRERGLRTHTEFRPRLPSMVARAGARGLESSLGCGEP